MRRTASIADRRVAVSTADRRLTASFTAGEGGDRVVERGGTLREASAALHVRAA